MARGARGSPTVLLLAAASLAAAAAALVTGIAAATPDREPLRYASLVQAGLERSLRVAFASAENVAYPWVADARLNAALASYASSAELYEIAEPNKLFSDYVEIQTRTLQHVGDVVFLDADEPRRKPLTMREELPVSFLKSLPAEPGAAEASRSEGRPVWHGPLSIGGLGWKALACSRLVRRPDGASIGLMVVLLNERSLSAALNDRLFAEGEPGSESMRGDVTLIVDRDGTVLSAPDPGAVGRGIRDISPLAGEGHGRASAEAPSSGALSSGAKRLGWAATPLPVPGWTLLTLLPLEGAALWPLPAALAAAAAAAAGAAVRLRRAARTTSAAGRPRREEGPAALDGLSKRERDILGLISRGKSNKEIAWELGVAEQTIKNQVSAIYEKLGIHDRVSAALVAKGAAMDGSGGAGEPGG